MARYTGPKNRIARREGQDLGLKTEGTAAQAGLHRRLNIPPGQHGQRRFGSKLSDYGIRLREKQKAKSSYGILEKQFKKYVETAVKEKENTIEALIGQLECRLDNVVYRLRLAPTRASARQFVSHRHILVDKKIVNIPSYQVKVNSVISLSNKSKDNPLVIKMLKEEEVNIPQWLTKEEFSGKIKALPKKEFVQEPIDWQLIVEYYTR